VVGGVTVVQAIHQDHADDGWQPIVVPLLMACVHLLRGNVALFTAEQYIWCGGTGGGFICCVCSHQSMSSCLLAVSWLWCGFVQQSMTVTYMMQFRHGGIWQDTCERSE
jgi:hypothetical protein